MAATVLIKASDLLTTVRDWANGKFVVKVNGKELSSNDFTDALLTKLNGIATGAEVNVIEGVEFKGSGESEYAELTIANKKVQLDLSNYALKGEIAAALNFKGTASGDDLKNATLTGTGSTLKVANGDVYSCTSDNTGTVTFHSGYEYAAVVTAGVLSWTELGKYLDLSGYVAKTQKVNGKALSGDITLAGSDVAITGYAKAAADAALAATDTVNGAFGKLEYKVDVNKSAIATLNGDNTTAGSVAKKIKDAIDDLDVSSVGGAGKYISAISEANGKIVPTASDFGSVASGNEAPVTGGAVYTAIGDAVKISTVKVNGTAQTLSNKELPFATGTTNGTIKVNGVEVSVAGLGSNAYTSTAFVPQTTKVNDKALSGNVTLNGADIALTGYSKGSDKTAVAATDTVNAAIAKLENKIGDAVTSVGLSMPSIFTVTGSPVTSSGTLTASLATQSANKVFAGPTTGSAAAPSFRDLVIADVSDVSFMTSTEALAILEATS